MYDTRYLTRNGGKRTCIHSGEANHLYGAYLEPKFTYFCFNILNPFPMPNVTIKGISEITLKLIRKKAAANSRSMNKEIIELLDKYALTRPIDSKRILKEIDKVKHLFKGNLSSASIRNAIRQGRE